MADIKLAKIHDGMGSPRSRPNDIPLSMMYANTSIICRNGQIRTINSRGAGDAPDLERSATRRCRAVAAIAKSMITNEGNHSHVRTSE